MNPLDSAPTTETDQLPSVEYSLCVHRHEETGWVVRRVSLWEGLSAPFELSVELLCEDTGLEVEGLLDMDAELVIDRQAVVRSVCGLVTRVEVLDPARDRFSVRLRISPALEALRHGTNSRLWQGMTVPQVVCEVVEAGLLGYGRELDASGLVGDYAARVYIVQYGESDLRFIARLLAEEGIAYHFDHERGTGREVMVLRDSGDVWPELTTTGTDAILPVIRSRAEQAEVESVQSISSARGLRATQAALRCFDWMAPSEFRMESATLEGPGRSPREVYRHPLADEAPPRIHGPADFLNRGPCVRFWGRSNAIGLQPGARFSLSEAGAGFDRELFVTQVRHTGDCPQVEPGGGEGGAEYDNEFECVLFDDRAWLPAPLEGPRDPGTQTAIVTGPEGEEIHTDEFGRVKVRFHWDRVHTLTDDTSVWVRVAQPWAGAGFGCVFTPRVGMEVVVEFINGDPARPLIVGCVSNGDQAPPLDLPSEKTKSGIRTRSSPGGGGHNSLLFEDALGHEVIELHAQRDLEEVIRNCESRRIGRDRSQQVGGNLSESVELDDTRAIGGKQTTTVGGDSVSTVQGATHRTHKGRRETVVDGDDEMRVQGLSCGVHLGAREAVVHGEDTTTVVASGAAPARHTTTVEGLSRLDASESVEVLAGTVITLRTARTPGAGAHLVLDHGQTKQWSEDSHELVAERKLDLRAGTRLEARVDGASVVLEDDKVEIVAKEIRLVAGACTLVLDERGLSIEVNEMSVEAKGDIHLEGATVTVD